eukprot:gene10973-12136_t
MAAEELSPIADNDGSETEEDEEAEFEVMEAGQSSQSIVEKFLSMDLSQQPVYTQAAVGGATGWISGFAFSRVGKAFTAALGGSLLLIHLGSRAGYITVEWERLDKDVKSAQKNFSKKFTKNQNPRATKSFLRKGTKFLSKNMTAVGGFLGGFFLGMAS